MKEFIAIDDKIIRVDKIVTIQPRIMSSGPKHIISFVNDEEVVLDDECYERIKAFLNPLEFNDTNNKQ